MDYCCNPQWNVCGGTVIPPLHLEYVLIVGTKKHLKTQKKKNLTPKCIAIILS
jgi:hypothetical protein